MKNNSLSPEEYELHLKDLSQRLEAFLHGNGGDAGRLLNLAEELIGMSDSFPEIYEKHRQIEGLIGETFARRKQQQFLSNAASNRTERGCLLGWLFGK